MIDAVNWQDVSWNADRQDIVRKMMNRMVYDSWEYLLFSANAYVLPPGQVGVIEVETVELLPVGSDDVLASLDFG